MILGTTIRSWRSGMAAAPDSRARPAIGVGARGLAAMTVVACMASLGGLGSLAWNHRIDLRSLETPPFKLGDAAWRSVLTVAATSDRSCPPSVPVVIIYVDRSCGHCRAELERWAERFRGGAERLPCVGVAVVAVPGADSASSPWLPPELLPMLFWDRDHTVARALSVRLVPLAAYVTASGVVNARVAGEASEESTLAHLDALRRASDTTAGVH